MGIGAACGARVKRRGLPLGVKRLVFWLLGVAARGGDFLYCQGSLITL